MKKYYSNGKLLLTGEYVVLDGALSLAIPTTFGQSLQVETITEPQLIWTSLDEQGFAWFETVFKIEEIATSPAIRNDKISERLFQILNAAKQLNPDFFNTNSGYKVTSRLDFAKNWGLGSSSTLINNVAQWAHVNAFTLLEKTFGGSGYDIACAQYNHPLTYQLQPFNGAQGDITRQVSKINFNPSFKEHLYFVYLNKKQNSRDGIAMYQSNKAQSKTLISEISDITLKMITCQSLNEFDELITYHEKIISKTIKQKPIKERLFNDFNGGIKSLGAWGGDFILVTSENNPKLYFEAKGFETIIPYNDMVLKV